MYPAASGCTAPPNLRKGCPGQKFMSMYKETLIVTSFYKTKRVNGPPT